MEKKKKFIAVGAVLLLVIGGGGYYYANEQKKAEQERIYVEKIDKKISTIEEMLDKVTKEKDQAKKLDELKQLIEEQDTYNNGEEKDKRVLDAYEKSINQLKEAFIAENKKTLEANQSKEINKENIKGLKTKNRCFNRVKRKS